MYTTQNLAVLQVTLTVDVVAPATVIETKMSSVLGGTESENIKYISARHHCND